MLLEGSCHAIQATSVPLVLEWQGVCRVTAGQARGALHSIVVMQAYQAKVLDQGPEVFAELRHTTDFALWATKQTASAIGRNDGGHGEASVAELVEIREKENNFLLDAPVLPS